MQQQDEPGPEARGKNSKSEFRRVLNNTGETNPNVRNSNAQNSAVKVPTYRDT
jgi:hypothetical protein